MQRVMFVHGFYKFTLSEKPLLVYKQNEALSVLCTISDPDWVCHPGKHKMDDGCRRVCD